MPDLSIVIPVYNTEEAYLRPCFASIEACSHAGISLEAVVIDDGSDPSYGDKLTGILADYDVRLSLHRKDNGGQNSARALGASLAKGKYLLFVDSDDRLVPDELSRVVEAALEFHPRILCFNYDRVSPGGSFLMRCDPWRGGYRTSESLSDHILESDSLVRQLYCRKSFLESGVHLVEGPRIGEDMASAVALLLAMGGASSIGATPYLYVERPTSVMHAVSEDTALDIIRSVDGMLSQIAPESRKSYASELEALCILHVLFWGGSRSIKASTVSDAHKTEFFDWMDLNFPAWRENPCLGEMASRYGLAFRLVVAGRWRSYAVLSTAKGVLKRIRASLSTMMRGASHA